MNKKSKFTKKLLLDIGVMTAILLPLFLGILFFRSRITNAVDTVIEDRAEVLERTRAINDLVTLRNQYNSFGEDYLTVMYNIIPSKDQLINLSQEFQTIANNEDIGFGFSFLGESPASDNDLGYISFRLSITSDSVEKVANLIDNIENFRYLTTLDEISIQSRNDEISSNIEGRVFFRD